MQGHRIGYVRVSSFDQNPERQLEQTQVSKLFTDKASGKDTQRPQLEALLSFVREGDTVLGFRFAPRIRDLGETKLYVPQGVQTYPTLRPLIGGTLNIKHVRAHWDDILRLASSIKQGTVTVTASLMLRKLGSYPRQNGLAVALRELGRIERTLFILDWLQSVELRCRVHAGLNKGEARNSLARAVFFNRLGEIRDRSFEQQRYRASGLNLVMAAIVQWNTVYLERATQAMGDTGKPVDGELLQYLSPLGWEHINLTGDYVWRQSRRLEDGKFRPLRLPGKPQRTIFSEFCGLPFKRKRPGFVEPRRLTWGSQYLVLLRGRPSSPNHIIRPAQGRNHGRETDGARQ